MEVSQTLSENAHWGSLPTCDRAKVDGIIAFGGMSRSRVMIGAHLRQLAKRVSSSVKASITFSDLTDHLGRMAL